MPQRGPQLDAAIHQAVADARSIAEVRILFHPSTGECEVFGPMANPVLFLGMLEIAKMNLMRYLQRRDSLPTPIVMPHGDDGGKKES